jgi:hypothetical protein
MMSVWDFKEYRLVALIYLIMSIGVGSCRVTRASRRQRPRIADTKLFARRFDSLIFRPTIYEG